VGAEEFKSRASKGRGCREKGGEKIPWKFSPISAGEKLSVSHML
jgi:hypothetical protein